MDSRCMVPMPLSERRTVRRKLPRKSVEDNFSKAMEKGLAFARSKDAVYLPGWCGPASDD